MPRPVSITSISSFPPSGFVYLMQMSILPSYVNLIAFLTKFIKIYFKRFPSPISFGIVGTRVFLDVISLPCTSA